MSEDLVIKYHFKDLGYTKVKVNNWEGKRIYVDLTKNTTFSYGLSKDYKVTSKKLLSKDIYKEAMEAARKVKRLQKKT